jgi:hypothetical protein
MIDKITKSELRELLDQLNLTHRILDDGNFVCFLDADEKFGYDVNILFSINEDQGSLNVFGCSPKFKISENMVAHALVKCNDHNRESYIGQAYLDKDDDVCISYTVCIDEPVSESFIKENIIKLSIGTFWKFYCDFVK